MDREQKLDEIITAYLKAVEAGEPIDQAEWLKRYPDLADDLAEFFAGQRSVERVAVSSFLRARASQVGRSLSRLVRVRFCRCFALAASLGYRRG